MEITPIIGFLAGFLIIISSIPQIIKTVKTKKAKDISLGMFSILFIAAFLWLTYGILIKNWVIIITNAIVSINTGIILGLKIRYG